VGLLAQRRRGIDNAVARTTTTITRRFLVVELLDRTVITQNMNYLTDVEAF